MSKYENTQFSPILMFFVDAIHKKKHYKNICKQN